MSEKPMKLIDDPNLVKQVSVPLWVGDDGLGCKDEQMARWAACTHVRCSKCNEPAPKERTMCETCRDKSEFERWKAREEAETWEWPLYSEATDEYYWGAGILEDDMHENGYGDINEMMLLTCEPCRPRLIGLDYLIDDLCPDDCDDPERLVDKEVLELVDAINKKLEAHKPISWIPGKKKVTKL